MPCYEPPRPDVHDNNMLRGEIDKYVATLKDIEDSCKDPKWAEHTGDRLATDILDIIHSYWAKT